MLRNVNRLLPLIVADESCEKMDLGANTMSTCPEMEIALYVHNPTEAYCIHMSNKNNNLIITR